MGPRFAPFRLRAFVTPIVTALFLGSTGCASSGLVSAAEKGDLATLKQRIEAAKRAGKLDGGEVRDAAKETAVRSVKQAEKGADLDDVRMCVRDLETPMLARTKQHDEAGARAAYLLLDEDRVGTSRWSSQVSSPDPAWRAVGARTLVSRSDGKARRELFLDLDPRVRIGAIEAAYRALDKADAGPLLEVVRLDPDGVARNIGARTVGAIGGRDVVLGLRDRWVRADEPLRAAIVSSWGFTASFDDGGHDALVWAAETQSGSPGVTAGSTLFRATQADRPIGRAALIRALNGGSTPVRMMAIQLSPLDDAELRAEIEKATESPDTAVKVAALGKLALRSDKRKQALEELGGIAASEDRAANAAKVALAVARDRRVVALLVKDLGSTLPEVRAWAGGVLAGMHELQEAAPVLADADKSVRARVACAIVNAPSKLPHSPSALHGAEPLVEDQPPNSQARTAVTSASAESAKTARRTAGLAPSSSRRSQPGSRATIASGASPGRMWTRRCPRGTCSSSDSPPRQGSRSRAPEGRCGCLGSVSSACFSASPRSRVVSAPLSPHCPQPPPSHAAHVTRRGTRTRMRAPSSSHAAGTVTESAPSGPRRPSSCSGSRTRAKGCDTPQG